VDHYFIYIIKKKDFSLGKAYRYMVGVRKMDRKQQFLFILKDNKILLFHTLEFILLFSLLITGISYGLGLSKMYLYLYLAGMGFHLVLDIFMEKTYKEKYSIVLFMIAKKKYNLG
jgi:hypothetical protein